VNLEDFQIQFLSFFVIQVDGKGEQADKSYKHYQTLDGLEYENSSLKEFLNGELMRISYPFMPEEGILEEHELKINQSSHARYFEDFLKYVEYG
jgi:hypothetical protein